MPACSLCRYQTLLQEASRHLTRASSRGGFAGQLHAPYVSTLAPGFEAGVRLLQGGRRPSTVKSYDQKWLKIENFTPQVQDDEGVQCMSTLPAPSQTVVAYLGYLLESGIMQITVCIQRF